MSHNRYKLSCRTFAAMKNPLLFTTTVSDVFGRVFGENSLPQTKIIPACFKTNNTLARCTKHGKQLKVGEFFVVEIIRDGYNSAAWAGRRLCLLPIGRPGKKS